MSTNIFSVVEARCRHDAPLLYTEDGTTISYGDMLALTARYANLLASLGVVKGDRVAAQVEKSPEALFLYLAVIRMGAIYLPMNTAYQLPEMEYFFKDAQPTVFVHDPANATAKQELAMACGIPHCLTLDGAGLGSLSDQCRAQSASFATVDTSNGEVAAILYTSGTTGRPKGVMISHENLLANGEALVKLWGFTGADIQLHALPLFHAHGLFLSTHCALLSGSSMIFLKKFVAAKVVEMLPRATVMMGVPTFYTRLLDTPQFDLVACHNVRLFVSGSAPLLPETALYMQQRTGHTVLERYGMTESLVITSNPLHGERRIGSVGLPIEGTELRLADEAVNDNRPLPAGTVGAIQIRGPAIMKGYWRNPEKTAEELTSDGWFKTGDLGVLSEDGYLTIVGRSKDLIISGGYNIYPKEVESILNAIPGVVESAVVGVAHRDFGEAVTAVLVCSEPVPSADDIMASLKGQLANYKLPKKIFFVAEFPRNAMGKVLKNELRAIYGKV
ncbi:AMP-binding protein [Noviherbaspirillum sedimenti]|uniref:Malonyl-CoA synthase n=1 Tax=Noviherbaspirillum sedimenti TaxID=2320865 RepID=A0A3A3GT20_9BURK|nr:AMP-binding protein [Noviherbaspirillum sedimenti]RJG04140.1 malonyl-CoA synthase [Noviherbaspirillum sedimenti]